MGFAFKVSENVPYSSFYATNSSLFQLLNSPKIVILFAFGAHSLYNISPFDCKLRPYLLYEWPIFKREPSASLKIYNHLEWKLLELNLLTFEIPFIRVQCHLYNFQGVNRQLLLSMDVLDQLIILYLSSQSLFHLFSFYYQSHFSSQLLNIHLTLCFIDLFQIIFLLKNSPFSIDSN